MQQLAFPIGERHFWVPLADRSIINDARVRQLLDRAGLESFSMGVGEDAHAFGERVLSEALAKPVSYQLLGALILPEGARPEDWNDAMGQDTAEYLQGLSVPSARATLRVIFARMLEHFFASGSASIWTSPTSSAAQSAGGAPEQPSSPLSTIDAGASAVSGPNAAAWTPGHGLDS